MADPSSRTGTTYASAALLAWVDALHHPLDEAARRAFEAPAREAMPAVQVGRGEGALIALLLRLHGARRVVEVGALAGFSAIQIARAIPPGGHLWSVERDPHHARVAREGVAGAGLAGRVTVCEGAGADVLPTLAPHGPFDAIFLDADKTGYEGYLAWAVENLRPGALLLADNTFFFGQLLDDGDDAAAVRRFHEKARAAFDTVHVPTPDGLLVGIKR